jgi:UDP-2-acetamido-3-amino-2,3-dideoxy-glucuronate N-acetyltransferase
MLHHTAEVQTKNIGDRTEVWQNCVILEGAVIGNDCNICFNVFIENDVKIGNDVVIKSGVQLWDGLTLEDNIFIGPNVTFTNDLLPRSNNQKFDLKRTVIKKGASIGANSTIICGITIGKYAMIGAASMVTKSVPDYTLWYGNPAKFKGYVCKCGEKLDDNSECTKCNRIYQLKDGLMA